MVPNRTLMSLMYLFSNIIGKTVSKNELKYSDRLHSELVSIDNDLVYYIWLVYLHINVLELCV